MNIKIHSYSINERKKKYILSKAIKYIKLLRFSNLMEGRTLTIKVLKKGYLLDTKTEAAIFVLPLSKRKNSKLSLNNTIIINNDIINDRKTLLKTLLHELVHLRQYLTRKLIYIDKYGIDINVVWSKKHIGDISLISYEKQPWEIEARRLEDKYWKEKKL